MEAAMVVLKTMEVVMVEIVADGTAEEVNGAKVEMIKTLPLLTIPQCYLVEWQDLYCCLLR